MTDAPLGTKRRGSTEYQPNELGAPVELQPNLSAPTTDDDSEPTPMSRANSSKNLQDDDDKSPDIETDDNKAPDIATTNVDNLKLQPKEPMGHRRRNTDGALRYPSTTLFKSASSNAAVIQLMQSELPPSARRDMQKKATDLRLERDLKHTQMKLREYQDQCNTAVEIIGKLEEEKEDLLSVTDTLRTQLGAAQTEIKILEQKVKSLEDVYQSERSKYEEELSNTKKQLTEMEEDMTQKNLALNEAKQYQKSMQQRYNNDQEDDTNGDIKKSTKKEKQLLKQLEKEKKKIIEKDNKIEKLLSQLENQTRVQHEKDNLQKEIDNLNMMAQQDIMMQKLQIEKMTQEIILLGSRNSNLEKEKEDLMALLEERDYENQMLKTGYGLHRTKTGKIGSGDMSHIAQQLINEQDDGYDETLETLAFMDQGSNRPIGLEDIDVDSEEYENAHSRTSRSASPTHKKAEKEVADVTREYLHLTASVVNMKFPRIQHISSEELINKVKNYQFWEYHDMMVRIMKTEEQKMVAKEKAEKEAKMQQLANNNQQQQNTGMLGRFRNFFAGGGATRGRRSTVEHGTQKVKAKSNETRFRNKSEYTETNGNNAKPTNTKRKGSLVQKSKTAALQTIGDAKGKLKEKTKIVGKKAADFKETTTKKVTGKPTDEEIADLNNLSFAAVGGLESPIYKNDDDDEQQNNGKFNKPGKPDQKL